MTANRNVFLLGSFILGAANVYIGYSNAGLAEPAAVEETGLHFFIDNTPKMSNSYSIINTLEGEQVSSLFNQLKVTKDGNHSIVEEVLKIGKDNNLYVQLGHFAEQVRIQFPEAKGLIVSSQTDKCELITFV